MSNNQAQNTNTVTERKPSLDALIADAEARRRRNGEDQTPPSGKPDDGGPGSLPPLGGRKEPEPER